MNTHQSRKYARAAMKQPRRGDAVARQTINEQIRPMPSPKWTFAWEMPFARGDFPSEGAVAPVLLNAAA
jgi:hypothetical protein